MDKQKLAELKALLEEIRTTYNTYVGARYVPRFVGDHVDTQSYEPLDVVDNGMGTSYIAKKPVPPNTPLTNTEYWFLYGSTSGAIVNLQQQINDMKDGDVSGSLQNQIDNMNDGDVSGSLQNQIDNMNDGDVSGSLQAQINTNSSDITALATTIEDLDVTVKRGVFITDSYGTHSANNWCSVLGSFFGLGGSNYYMWAEGSSGFEHAGLSGHTFLTLLQAHINDITNPNTITDVFVGGGTNDFYYFTSAASLKVAMENTADYIRTNFPNARIHYVFMGYEAVMTATLRTNYLNVIKLYSEIPQTKDVNFINAYKPMHVPAYREDRQHPNDNGSLAIAKVIYNALYNIEYPVIYDGGNVALTPSSDVTSITNNAFNFNVNDESFAVVKASASTIEGTFSITGTYFLKIGSFAPTDAQVFAPTEGRICVPVMVQTSGGWSCLPATLFTQPDTTNNVVDLYLTMVIPATTNATAIRIPPVSFTISLYKG